MSDLPKTVSIHEEGPREGFQIEKGPIATARKIELIDALSETGAETHPGRLVREPERGAADGRRRRGGACLQGKPGVRYTALWLNDRGFERAMACGASISQRSISLTASETFLQRNQQRTMEENIAAQRIEIMRLSRPRALPSSAPGSWPRSAATSRATSRSRACST